MFTGGVTFSDMNVMFKAGNLVENDMGLYMSGLEGKTPAEINTKWWSGIPTEGRRGAANQRAILSGVTRKHHRLHLNPLTKKVEVQVPVDVDKVARDPDLKGWNDLGTSGQWVPVQFKRQGSDKWENMEVDLAELIGKTHALTEEARHVKNRRAEETLTPAYLKPLIVKHDAVKAQEAKTGIKGDPTEIDRLNMSEEAKEEIRNTELPPVKPYTPGGDYRASKFDM